MELKKEIRFLIIMLLVVTKFAPVADALPIGALSGWSDNVDFDYSGLDGRRLTGQIEYAVYDVVDYPGNAPSGGQYIYAYQITNSQLSDVPVESFSVAILQDAHVGNINWDDYEVNTGVKPSLEYFSPTPEQAKNARFLFLPHLNGLVEKGDDSVILLFSSNSLPKKGWALIEGAAIGAVTDALPTPVPEPLTISLLGIGALLTLIRKGRPV